MVKSLFQEKLQNILTQIGPEALAYDEKEAKAYAELYHLVEEYALEKQLLNTLVAMQVVRAIMSQAADKIDVKYKNPGRHLAYLNHCFAVTRMLIDFHIPLSKEEEDIALAATICHILPENLKFQNLEEDLTERYHLHPEVYHVVDLITRDDDLPEAFNKTFYARIQQHKLALLIKLADRGNLVESLYRISSWEALKYIRETRTYFLPMCIYAKEHFPEILGTINVMTEKMRCHIEVNEILLTRFEAREAQLTQDILNLREENSRIRMVIQTLKQE